MFVFPLFQPTFGENEAVYYQYNWVLGTRWFEQISINRKVNE